MRMLIVSSLLALATPAVQSVPEAAQAAFDAGEWETVVEQLAPLASAGELGGEGHYQLGFAHWRLGDCEAALDAYAGARESHAGNPRLLGTAAICAARLGRADAALSDLEAALTAGGPPRVLLGDAAFADYADDPRYVGLRDQYAAQLAPCMHDENARQFDFWIGEWDVYSAGAIAGANRITREQDGCVLREEWASPASTGSSINFYDRERGKWRQVWIDNSGNVTHYEGTWADGSLSFEGTNVGPDGSLTPMRMVFTPNEDGSVRQLFHSSADGGETWTVWFDGHYVPRGDS